MGKKEGLHLNKKTVEILSETQLIIYNNIRYDNYTIYKHNEISIKCL